MAHCCNTMWGGILKLIMLIASIIPYKGVCVSVVYACVSVCVKYVLACVYKFV